MTSPQPSPTGSLEGPSQPPPPEIIQTSDGFPLYLNPHDNFICRNLRNDGVWEPTVRQAILDHLKPGWLFLDLGAHIGYFSMLALKQGADVVAVEPLPDSYNCLLDSVEANEFPGQFTLIPGVVMPYNGTAYMRAVKGNTGASHVSDHGLEVRAYKVRDILDGRWPEFIKADIEGCEYDVFSSTPRLLAEAKVVVFETHGAKDDNLVNLVRDAGFSLTLLHEGAYEDWLAIRPGL